MSKGIRSARQAPAQTGRLLNMRFLVNVQLSVDVSDAEAVRRVAWEMVATSEGKQAPTDEEFADEATKTTEHALAVIFAGIRVMDALEGAINPVPDLTMTGIYVQANWVEPLI
jgi:hypothetical protein